jgi:hypothetical protein
MDSVTYMGEKKCRVRAERPASSRVHRGLKGLVRKNRDLQYCTTPNKIVPFGG